MTAVSELDLPRFDPDDPALAGERFHAVLRDLRARHWLARADIGYAVLDRSTAIEVLRDRRLAFPAMELLAFQGVVEGPIHERTATGLMVRSGEPHLRLRRLVAPALSPRSIDRLRARLRSVLEERWAAVEVEGRCDVLPAFARPIPAALVAELLGVPGEEDRLARWSIELQSVFKLEPAERRPEVERAYREVQAWVLALLEERRRGRGPDFVSSVATFEEDGDRLTDDECVTLVSSVISGGIDTTQAQLAHGLRLFAEHPEQWERLAGQPELASRAATEVLRFEPITPFTARLVRDQVTYRDVAFPAGTVLFACAATANRDPSAFERPDEFDISIDRGREPVLTFGFGDHFCLGAQLARMELAETFGFLAPRMRGLRLDGEPVFGSRTGIYEMASVPVAFDAG